MNKQPIEPIVNTIDHIVTVDLGDCTEEFIMEIDETVEFNEALKLAHAEVMDRWGRYESIYVENLEV